MILNRIKLGTSCTVRETGQEGTVKQIYFYPTKYELEFPDGRIEHHSLKDLEIDGFQQKEATLKIPPVPDNGIGISWNEWSPFKGESKVEHHFATTKEIIWEMLTSLEMYNVWFYGIQRALPVIDTKRYVHQYSFDHLELKPGNYFKIRPKTIAPWFECRIMTLEKEKEFGFTFRNNPFMMEYIQFSIRESDYGVWVTCTRSSQGLLSILSQLNWNEKAKILQNLDRIIPKVDFLSDDEQVNDSTDNTSQDGGFSSRQDYIDYAINMGIKGNMDYVDAIPQKPIRGMAKAGIVKSKRTGIIPPCPEKPIAGTTTTSGGGISSLSKDELVAYFVNIGLDGDMDKVNSHDDKIIRGKAKAMMVKINRGSIERPPMPKLSTNESTSPNNEGSSKKETDEELLDRLVAKGLTGDMEEINALENRVLRGKIKSAVIKAKRSAK